MIKVTTLLFQSLTHNIDKQRRPNTRDKPEIINDLDMVNTCLKMVIFMLGTGKTIILPGKASTFLTTLLKSISTQWPTLATSKRDFFQALGNCSHLFLPRKGTTSIKVTGETEGDKALANNSIIRMKITSMLATGTTMKEMGKRIVCSFQTANSKVVGKMAKCKA